MKEKLNPDPGEVCLCGHDRSSHLDGESCSIEGCNCWTFCKRDYDEEDLREDINDIIKALSAIEKSGIIDLDKCYGEISASIHVLQIHKKRISIKLAATKPTSF